MPWRMPRVCVSQRCVQRGANPALSNIRFWSNLSGAAQLSARRGKLIVLVNLSVRGFFLIIIFQKYHVYIGGVCFKFKL